MVNQNNELSLERARCTTLVVDLPNETQTLILGQALANALTHFKQQSVVVFLRGTLGAGKTTLSRGLLNGLGNTSRVKSPTYTLVEPYELETIDVFHFDLYRLGDPEELEYIGIRDYFEDASNGRRRLCLVEWPEQGGRCLPAADLELVLRVQGTGRVAQVKIFESGHTMVPLLSQALAALSLPFLVEES